MKITIDHDLKEITVHHRVNFKDLKKLAKFCKKNKITDYSIKMDEEILLSPYIYPGPSFTITPYIDDSFTITSNTLFLDNDSIGKA